LNRGVCRYRAEGAMSIRDDTKFDESLWWVERWVSGCETDPEWDDSWTSMSMDDVFLYIASKVKTKARGPLYRAIIIPKQQCDQIINKKILPTNHRVFQSFTTTLDIAIEESREINQIVPKGCIRLVIEVAKPPILFALNDLKSTSIWHRLADWVHQNEVFVDGRKPLPVSMTKIFTT